MNRLLSWPGAKFRQMSTLLSLLPRCPRLVVEPFFGTGAFTWAVGIENLSAVFAGDKSPHLGLWWDNLLKDPQGFVALLGETRAKYAAAKEDRAVFDLLRDGYNARFRAAEEGTPEACAMLWVLIYQSTNNLARFNSSGYYNQTWGKGRSVPDPAVVFGPEEMQAIELLETALVYGFKEDFRDTLDEFLNCGDRDGAIVFLDPPYIVRTETYQRGCWTLDDERDLLRAVQILDDEDAERIWTTYLGKDDVRHPFEKELHKWNVLPLDRGMDARPTGQGTAAEEVVVTNLPLPIGEPHDR
jgi:site-specific DNA-adenine methylase